MSAFDDDMVWILVIAIAILVILSCGGYTQRDAICLSPTMARYFSPDGGHQDIPCNGPEGCREDQRSFLGCDYRAGDLP